ncbi:DUF3618 domain-containing protein [Kribbella pittospori]|uniref:DUF3618 domain-containing protein n=1 Tax=Kribbella pittospori TaxID=722689 RepID=A0A4R0KDS6_9ACTN|nr:DUF3618 domain-containing protein [Kribbella pittospori]TCC58491.1 DUF3618 domain-containing protein [Kribbella pittospori]
MTTNTSRNADHREPMPETEALRIDLEMTRQHLADTVQQLSRQLDVPRRIKDSAGQAGHRVKDSAGQAGQRIKATAGQAGQRMQGRMKDVPGQVKGIAASLRHPKTTAAVGGALALGVGAAAWMARKQK